MTLSIGGQLDCSELPEMLETKFIIQSRFPLREDLGNIQDLSQSIKSIGLLQPILVRPIGSRFEVVAGNRRFVACKRLRLSVLSCMIRELSDKEAFEVSLTENLQRHSISIIEEANAFREYTEKHGWGSTSVLASRIGKSEAYVSHIISILQLPHEILNKIRLGEIGRSLAQELVWVRNKPLQLELAQKVSKGKLTIKQIRAAKNGAVLNDEEDTFPVSNNWLRNIQSNEFRMLTKAALTLRISMIRLDSVIERVERQDIRNFLIEKRFRIHNVVDEILSKRRDLPTI